MKRHLVAVDIGGSKIAILAREIGAKRDVYADKVKTPAQQGVDAILKLLDEQLNRLPGGRSTLKAMGVGVPGHVDPAGHVLSAGNLKGWVNVPLRTLLEERYQVPIFVERDANCGVLGEKWCGAATKMNDFVFLALGTGIGAGLFLEGQIYRGAHFAAGEAGDMSFPSTDANQDARPTLFEIVGKRGIMKRVKRATGKKMSPTDALKQAKSERRLKRITNEVVEHLSSAVVAIFSLLDPEAILFGGGTSKAGEALLKRVRKRIPRHFLVRAPLKTAGLQDESQLYGALWGAESVAGLMPSISWAAIQRHARHG